MKDKRIPPPGVPDSISGKGEYVAHWAYRAVDGEVLGFAVRYEESGKKCVLPFFGREGDRWINKGPTSPRPLFGLDVLAARTDDLTLVVEGEKCAVAVSELGGVATTVQGGAGGVRKTDWRPLAGRSIVVWVDNDEPGKRFGQEVLASLAELEPVPVRVRVIEIEELDLPEKGDVVDWIAANPDVGLQDLFELPVKDVDLDVWRSSGGLATEDDRRVYLSKNAPTIEYVKETRKILASANASRLAAIESSKNAASEVRGVVFHRGGSLARVRENLGSYSIRSMKIDEVSAWLRREVRFGRIEKKEDSAAVFVNVDPPLWIAKDIAAIVPSSLPVLRRVSTTPFFNERGKLAQTNGYNRENGVLMILSEELQAMKEVGERVSAAELEEARELILEELLGDFPFVGPADRAHAVAALLLPFVRNMVVGPTPMHLIVAASQGSGKTLLADVISVVATGSSCGARSLSDNDNEVRKLITSELLEGTQIMLFDNLPEQSSIHSQPLAIALSATIWKDRHLGKNRVVTVLNEALWMATGNNPSLSKDIVRRCVRCRIDPGVERPELRKDFRHFPLLPWVVAHRAELVWANVVLVQNWISEGCPESNGTFGTFDSWTKVLGGILDCAGIKGFLENQNELYDSADDEWSHWAHFFSTWFAVLGGDSRTPMELLELCDEHNLLLGVRGDGNERSQASLLGRALKKNIDRIYNSYRLVLVKDGGRRNGRRYCLETVEIDPTVSDEAQYSEGKSDDDDEGTLF